MPVRGKVSPAYKMSAKSVRWYAFKDETSNLATSSYMRKATNMMSSSGLSVKSREMPEFWATNHLQTRTWNTKSAKWIKKAVRVDTVKLFQMFSSSRVPINRSDHCVVRKPVQATRMALEAGIANPLPPLRKKFAFALQRTWWSLHRLCLSFSVLMVWSCEL